MKLFSNIKEGLRNKMRSFLKLDKAMDLQIIITEGLDEETKTIKNKIWYRGDSYELSQLYSQLPNKEDTFWGATQTASLKMRKIHTGLPALIIDVLTDIVMGDYNGIDFNDNKVNEAEWKDMEKDNSFNDILKEAICQSLYMGQGAFKFSFDNDVSEYPIIEYYSKDQIEVIKKRKRVREIIFKTKINENNKNYLLKERYGYGYILYELYDENNKRIYDLNSLEETKGLENYKFAGAEFDKDGNMIKPGDFMLACLFKIKEDSIYDKKTDNFDAFDESWSQWMDALRAGRTREYIPSALLPRDPNTGKTLNLNSFDNRFIEVADDLTEDGKNRIHIEQAPIPTNDYAATYATALDQALQGIISPSTLGIDTKKITDPNAAAQREKEKTTLYTRGLIVNTVEKTLPQLVDLSFKFIDLINNKSELRNVETKVKFGEYANPSFEAQVETVGKGKSQGIMSIEASVDELYGDSKDDEWKSKEVARLKAEQGIVDVEEPAVNDDLKENNLNNENNQPNIEPKENEINEQ